MKRARGVTPPGFARCAKRPQKDDSFMKTAARCCRAGRSLPALARLGGGGRRGLSRRAPRQSRVFSVPCRGGQPLRRFPPCCCVEGSGSSRWSSFRIRRRNNLGIPVARNAARSVGRTLLSDIGRGPIAFDADVRGCAAYRTRVSDPPNARRRRGGCCGARCVTDDQREEPAMCGAAKVSRDSGKGGSF